jgi:hypothetical protein
MRADRQLFFLSFLTKTSQQSNYFQKQKVWLQPDEHTSFKWRHDNQINDTQRNCKTRSKHHKRQSASSAVVLLQNSLVMKFRFKFSYLFQTSFDVKNVMVLLDTLQVLYYFGLL